MSAENDTAHTDARMMGNFEQMLQKWATLIVQQSFG
jgi:hypothetical protein